MYSACSLEMLVNSCRTTKHHNEDDVIKIIWFPLVLEHVLSTSDCDFWFTDQLDAKQIALQEAKYEIITSEASYYKSLLILETVFIRSKELTDRSVLSEEDYSTLFSSAKKG
jgi:hypothetical protein